MLNKDRRVLLIDSDARDRTAIARFLENEQYQVETGKSLTDAIKKIADENYDCLIMDVNLPEMKGYEAVSIIKNLDSGVKIIMMTRKNSKRLEAKVREQDVFFYFIKSFGNEELKLAINNAFIK
jgi:DNA-binding response OmpR family regulator